MKNKKGQVSIELMLIIIIVLLYINTVSRPYIESTTGTVQDITRIAQGKLAVDKISNAVGYVSALSGESQQTISIYLPERTRIAWNDITTQGCIANHFCMQVALEQRIGINPPNACLDSVDGDTDDWICTANISTLANPSGTGLEWGALDNEYSDAITMTIKKDGSGNVTIS
jgi:uncharacterized protein (UPF0333 family)